MLMRKLFTLLLICTAGVSFGQNKYLVLFKDKTGSLYSVEKPEAFLSRRAIDRRNAQQIKITEQDLPVSSAYLEALQERNINVLYTSRWLNAVLVDVPESRLEEISALGFVKSIDGLFSHGLGGPNSRKGTKSLQDFSSFDAGSAQNQLEMLGADVMQTQGYTGKGVLIGLLDSGFSNANNLDVFKQLFEENRVLETYNFVSNNISVYNAHSHGTSVLSCIAANLSGEMIGTAPEASFVLYVTEDVRSETRLEEVNWLIAAERADSIGVDIIGSSLGYSDFEGTEQDYSYEDLDGNTALISRAADWAASKGILVVVSAGNEGNKAWKYITAPADADSVISVAAVDGNQNYASFSSIGPSADNQIKPEVAAKGLSTTVASPGNFVGFSNGTSFAAPLITGLVAGLKQAFPDLTAMELRQILLESGSQYSEPDNLLGYGIPNFSRAYEMANLKKLKNSTDKPVLVFPNPSGKNEKLSVLITKEDLGNTFQVTLHSTNGILYYSGEFKRPYFDLPLTKSQLPTGIYILRIQNELLNTTERVFIE